MNKIDQKIYNIVVFFHNFVPDISEKCAYFFYLKKKIIFKIMCQSLSLTKNFFFIKKYNFNL